MQKDVIQRQNNRSRVQCNKMTAIKCNFKPTEFAPQHCSDLRSCSHVWRHESAPNQKLVPHPVTQPTMHRGFTKASTFQQNHAIYNRDKGKIVTCVVGLQLDCDVTRDCCGLVTSATAARSPDSSRCRPVRSARASTEAAPSSGFATPGGA